MSELDIHAVPGLEATHEWDGGTIILGDNQGDLPRYYLDEIQGLHSTPEFEDNRQSSVGRGRERPLPSLPLGKTIAYVGRTQADTAGDCRSASGQLRAALIPDEEQLSEAVFRIVPDPAYGGHTYRFMARITRAEQDDKIAFTPQDMPGPWQRNFTITVRMSDGRFIVDDDPQEFTSPNADGTDNPFVDVLNEGTAPADPIIRIYAPVAPPIIERPGYMLEFDNSVAVGAGHYIDVDFAARTAITDLGVDVVPHITPDSTWWDRGVAGIPKGPADGSGATTRITLRQAAGHPGIGAHIRVQFDPAVW